MLQGGAWILWGARADSVGGWILWRGGGWILARLDVVGEEAEFCGGRGLDAWGTGCWGEGA